MQVRGLRINYTTANKFLNLLHGLTEGNNEMPIIQPPRKWDNALVKELIALVNEKLSVREISERLNLAHPAITFTVGSVGNKMADLKLKSQKVREPRRRLSAAEEIKRREARTEHAFAIAERLVANPEDYCHRTTAFAVYELAVEKPECKYPIGLVGSKDFCFCKKPPKKVLKNGTEVNLPYCEEHHRLCHTPAKPLQIKA